MHVTLVQRNGGLFDVHASSLCAPGDDQIMAKAWSGPMSDTDLIKLGLMDPPTDEDQTAKPASPPNCDKDVGAVPVKKEREPTGV